MFLMSVSMAVMLGVMMVGEGREADLSVFLRVSNSWYRSPKRFSRCSFSLGSPRS